MELRDVIQLIVQNALQSAQLCDVCFGTVVSVNPFKVQIDPVMQPLEAQSLILTEDVMERGLSLEDKLIMLRVNSGSQFLILSRLV